MSSLSSYLLRGHCRNLIKKSQPVRYHMHKGAYEGDGKTTITILNRDSDYGLMVDSISEVGFRLNVGLYILGPMIIFPRTVLAWHISSSNDIHEDSLTLFKVMQPKPDIVVLGLDDDYSRNAPVLTNFRTTMKKFHINFEMLPIDKACTTFNFLNAERRFVVGAFLPPRPMKFTESMKITTTSERRALLEPIEGSKD